MYPENPDMDFACGCPVKDRKNVWNDITGVHVRFCPICNTRRTQYYQPSQRWESTGRGVAGEAMPAHLRAGLNAANQERQAGGVGARPLISQ